MLCAAFPDLLNSSENLLTFFSETAHIALNIPSLFVPKIVFLYAFACSCDIPDIAFDSSPTTLLKSFAFPLLS